MIYSTSLLKKLDQNTIYQAQPAEQGNLGNVFVRGRSCMKFLVAKNVIGTSYIKIWAKDNDDTTNIPPILPLSSFKEGVEYNITVQKYACYLDALGATPLATDDTTLLLVGYF